MEVCKDLKIPICHISTDEVYGPIAEGSFSEDDKLSPQNFYSATKAAAEHIVCAYSNTFDIDYVMVRMSNNYGPRQNSEKFIPTILRSVKNESKIPVYGDGLNVRDWIYVKDSVKIIYNILQGANFDRDVYNITFRDEKTNMEVIESILQYFNLYIKDCVEFVPDRLGHDSRYSITNNKMMQFVDFERTSFQDGLEATIKQYLQEGHTCL
jgi:dTDP-glucose 4,6-dehydratase|tara:strand:- start:72 stop:701 length:630 start_codon:yes stop_codon:yes gene_type:complete